MIFGDITIPIEERKNWVWEQLALVYPEFERSKFPVDDPYALGEIVLNNCYRYKPKVNDVVLDIGANIGIFTMMCALRGATVVAHEPNRWAFQVLTKTILLNSVLPQVFASHLAVMHYTGRCVYHPTKTPPSGNLQTWTSFNGAVDTPGEDPTETVECISLEDVIGDREWDCVKMDIEGAEFRVLGQTNANVFRQIKYLTVELHNGHAAKVAYDVVVQGLEGFFTIEGVKDGDPRWAHEDRYISLFCTRR